LDELVADKKINADQRAQALKKPVLQAHVTQLEEQIAHYKQFAAHYEDRLLRQKRALEAAHRAELESVRTQAAADAQSALERQFRRQLLSLSQFLRAAAALRGAGDDASPENRAFEGVLFQVYGGSDDAVDAMLKLIEGSPDKVPSVESDLLDVTCAYPSPGLYHKTRTPSKC
jgi:membrane peptidoglycan carboxypeptidase